MALSYCVNIVANYVAKFALKKNLAKLLLICSCVSLFLSLLIIIFLKSNVVIYFITLFINFNYQMLFISLFNIFINDQKHKNMYYHSLFYRDVFQNIARSSLSCIFQWNTFIILSLSPYSFNLCFASRAVIKPFNFDALPYEI